MAKTTVPGLYIADGAITAAKLSSTLDLSGVTLTVATASSGDNDTTVASTAFVQQEIASLVDSSPSALNTLNELAAAIGDDANFSTTVTNSIATKLALAGGTMTGDLIINTTGSIQIPVGTTAQRPTAAQGQLRFNTTTSKPEIYNGSAWADVGGGVESVNSATGVVTLDTDDISEGSTNLYFTNARADARIAAATTDDLSEGSTNLYFTTARANSAIDGRLSGSTGVTVSNGAISIGQDVATSTSPTFQNLTLSGTDSIKVPSGTTAQRSGSPANGMLRYNSSTNEFEGYADSAWGAIGGDTTSSVDLYTATGNGSTSTYDTGKNPQSENNTWVFIGGVYQPKSTYSFSGTQITLSENLPNGEDLEVITGTVSTYNPTDAILGQYNVTTSNTASYDTSLTTENENNVFVFIDGVYQPKSSYTYSGSTLTLDATPTSGMSLEVLVTRSMNAATVTTGFLADDAVTTVKILDANVTAGKLASSLDLTGKTVTVATASAGDNDTSVASTAFVRQEITSLVDSAPAAMDTLNELAAALGDDANFSTTVNASIAAKLPLAGGTLTGNLNFGDNDKAVFGAGSDLQIFHDGSNSFIDDTGTGNLYIRSNLIQLRKYTGEDMITALADGAVTLYYDNSPKLATTSTGIDVTGTVDLDNLTIATSQGTDGQVLTSTGSGIAWEDAPAGYTDSDVETYLDGGTSTPSFASIVVNGTIKLDGNYPTGTGNVALGDTALDSLTSGGYNVAIGSQALTANTEGSANIAMGFGALDANSTGGSNTSIGHNSLTANTTASNNTALGSATLQANTTGAGNTAIGKDALNANTTASNNTAVGLDALTANTTGFDNTALGANTLLSNTTGDYNTAVGKNALYSATTADNNTSVGFNALSDNTTGQYNVALGVNALLSNTTANDNVAVGTAALKLCTTGTRNTALGGNALDSLTTENDNTAVGYAALSTETTGFRNTAVGSFAGATQNGGTNNALFGYYAGAAITTGDANTFIGSDCGDATTTASNNTAVGQNAMGTNTTGYDNVAVGRNSLDANVGGHSNTAVGESSLTSNTEGDRNVAVGQNALAINTTGGENVAVGRGALDANTTASFNTAVGDSALGVNTTGTSNVAVGANALDANTTASSNTAVGQSSMSANTTGYRNSAFGQQSMLSNTTGSFNTALGFQALKVNTTSSSNTAVGYEAMENATGASNTAVGADALQAATGDNNVAIGNSALTANTTGSQNTVVGSIAGDSITTGGNNTIMGFNAGGQFDTGSGNTCFGKEAGMSIAGTNGQNNTAVGINALRSSHAFFSSTAVGQNCLTASTAHGSTAYGSNTCSANTTGENNNGFGYFTLNQVTTGNSNVAFGTVAGRYITTSVSNSCFGVSAGGAITTGNYNTAIGKSSSVTTTTGSNNTTVGYDSRTSGANAQSQIVIGSSVYGTTNNRVHIGNSGSHIYANYNSNATWTHSSDERAKKDIMPSNLGLDFINDLKPVTYKFKAPSEYPTEWQSYGANKTKPIDEKTHHGMIAQDIKKALDKSGVNDFEGWDVLPDGKQQISEAMFIFPLIKAMQQMSKQVDELKQEIKNLKGE